MRQLLIATTVIFVLILASCTTNAEPAPETPAIDPAVYELGESVFQANCSSCHSPNHDIVLVGPSMLGIADWAGSMIEGMDAYSYIEESILDPSAFLNEGFIDLMPPTYGESLTDEEIDAVIQYVMTLEN